MIDLSIVDSKQFGDLLYQVRLKSAILADSFVNEVLACKTIKYEAFISDKKAQWFKIRHIDDEKGFAFKDLGYCGIYNINQFLKTGHLFLLMAGSPKKSTIINIPELQTVFETIKTVGLDNLGLNQLYFYIVNGNMATDILAEFDFIKICGIRKKEIYRQGSFLDVAVCLIEKG